MSSCANIKAEFQQLADRRQATILESFFKTKPGEYGAGDVFLGIKVPVQRQLARAYKDLPIVQVLQLLHSKFHEHRLTALLILVSRFQTGTAAEKKKIYNLYLAHSSRINNWDLVDLTAPKIVGEYLLNRPRSILYKLAKSDNIWERRIAVLATFAFIKRGDFRDSLKIASLLIADRHDLIHKAVGWMLREVGKKDQLRLEEFLSKRSAFMPRTMLRYAIERLPPRRRQYYLELASCLKRKEK